MTTTMMQNGKLRKSLAEQIDRLDTILDGLADALNEAVADAVKGAVTLAVQQAVQGVLTEVLANPEVLDKLRAAVLPAVPPVPSLAPPAPPTPASAARGTSGRRVQDLCGTVKRWTSAAWDHVRSASAAVAGKAGAAAGKVRGYWRTARYFRAPVVAGLAVGTVAGVVAYFGGPYLAAAAGWLAGFTTTLSVQAGIWLRRLLLSTASTRGA
jgi:hypothetical protein